VISDACPRIVSSAHLNDLWNGGLGHGRHTANSARSPPSRQAIW
jgi:hypothetical protein